MLIILGRQHSQGILPYPKPENSHLLGIGIGALAAAAISSSEDVISIIPAAVYAVKVALHVGLRADQEAKSLDGPSSSQSWAMTVTGTSIEELQQLLQRFNLTNVGGPWKTRILASSLTILSGTPLIITCIRGQYFGPYSHDHRSPCGVSQAEKV